MLRILPRFLWRAPLLPIAALEGRARDVERRVWAEPLLRAALALAVPALAGNRDEGTDEATGARARRHYAQRAAFRPTPHGLWAGVGLGELGARTRFASGQPVAYLQPSWARLRAFGRALLDEPAGRARARLRVAPSLVHDGREARWLACGDGAEAIERGAEVDEPLAGVLAAAADWCPLATLRAALGGGGDADEYLLVLVDDGLLVHDLEPPLVGPPPLAWLRARLGGTWPGLDALDAACARAATEPEAALAQARALLGALPGAASDGAELHAVLTHRPRAATLSQAAVARAAALGPLLFALQATLAPPIAERDLDPALAAALDAVTEAWGAGALDLGALVRGDYGVALDGGLDDTAARAPDAAGSALLATLAGQLMEAASSGADEIALDPEALAALVTPVATPPTFELFLAPARERRGAAPGDGWLLGLHAPAGASWGRFAHALAAVDADGVGAAFADLGAAEAAARPGEQALDVAYTPAPALADLMTHPPLRAAALALSGWPAGAAVGLDRLELVHDAAAVEPLGLRGGGVALRPSPLGRVRSTTAPPGAWRLLTGWALTRQHAPWAFTWGALATLPWLPRLRLDGFVIAPASWALPPLADAAALRRWRARRRVPRYLQVGHEDELLLVDLEARDAVATLGRLGRDGARGYEVWPPLDANPDGDGRRLEAIVAVVDEPEDGARAATVAAIEAIAAAGAVPPPRAAPPAPGWHTFKLYGAAARADAVLVGAVGPAVAAAGEAGDIDTWFFLRYRERGRDQLRLRVRGHGDAFAVRLDAALAPAYAAGDVTAVERGAYHRELARYGVDAIDAVERVFAADSAVVLALLDGAAAVDALEATVLAYDALAAGAGLDLGARLGLAERRRRAYDIPRDPRHPFAAEQRRRGPRLRALLAAPPPPFPAHAAAVADALAAVAPERRLALLPPLLHLASVRLGGLDGAHESAALYLWERALAGLAKSPPGAPPRRG